MNETCEGEKERKELLKILRDARKQSIQALARKMKEQDKIIKGIKEQVEDGPKTVPEMARALDLPSSEIMWYVAALKKYGELAEGTKEEGYFRYEPAESGALKAVGKGDDEPRRS